MSEIQGRYVCKYCGAEGPTGIGYLVHHDEMLPPPKPGCPGAHAHQPYVSFYERRGTCSCGRWRFYGTADDFEHAARLHLAEHEKRERRHDQVQANSVIRAAVACLRSAVP